MCLAARRQANSKLNIALTFLRLKNISANQSSWVGGGGLAHVSGVQIYNRHRTTPLNGSHTGECPLSVSKMTFMSERLRAFLCMCTIRGGGPVPDVSLSHQTRRGPG